MNDNKNNNIKSFKIYIYQHKFCAFTIVYNFLCVNNLRKQFAANINN